MSSTATDDVNHAKWEDQTDKKRGKIFSEFCNIKFAPVIDISLILSMILL
jgi:hypothetical protein